MPPSEKVALTWPTAKYAIARSPTIDDTACESTHHLIVDVTRCDTVAAAGAPIGAEPALQRASIRGKERKMSNSQRVAVITGASQGIGEGLVTAYRKAGYAVVANSRTIAESDDPTVVTVPGDIAQTGVGQRIADAAMDYDAITGVNRRGFFEVSRAAVAAMLYRRVAVTS